MDRTAQLKKRFQDIIHGTVKIEPRGARLFLEGVCAHDDAAACLHDIVESSCGLSSIQAAMRFDLSSQFMNGLGSTVLAYLTKAADVGGDALHSVLLSIIDPPIFWSAFALAFEKGELNDSGQLAFAGTLLHLLSVPDQDVTPYRNLATSGIIDKLLGSLSHEVREMGHRLNHVLSMHAFGSSFTEFDGPGGRHDNDFDNFRDIALLPTTDELLSTRPPFIRSSFFNFEDHDSGETRVEDYLDNTFRLLREDMIHVLREEMQIVLRMKKGKHRGLRVDRLSMIGVYTGSGDRRTRWGLMLECDDDLRELKGVEAKNRLTFLTKDNRGSKILRHQSLACLIANNQILSFGTIQRVEELLAKNPPVIVLGLHGEASTAKTLSHLSGGEHVQLVQIDTAFFAFEPVLLALKRMRRVPLCEEILFWEKDALPEPAAHQITRIIEPIRSNPSVELKSLLTLAKSVTLDSSQAKAMVEGLGQRVSLIQGPPGTGKSFIGTLIAKAIHDYTAKKILVVCYTNHALDQFLNDLIERGIPYTNLVRLGDRCDSTVERLSLKKQPRPRIRRPQEEWDDINSTKSKAGDLDLRLQRSFQALINARQSNTVDDLLLHIHRKYFEYYEAFVVPEEDDGMVRVGKKGQAVDEQYLIKRWMQGFNAGIYEGEWHVRGAAHIWSMDNPSRQEMVKKWESELENVDIEEACEIARDYNACQDKLKCMLAERSTVAILREKRIIGCTTTGAAKHTEAIKEVGPNVLLVEEAGEILESHVVTALGPDIEQMILIGDHKQLRPKVNNYQLTVEKGDGYDLNRSLFERLVLQGFPHATLSSQHRMRPEISAFVRELTYPELVDEPSTRGRPDIRGVQSNVIFIDHAHPEDEDTRISDRADASTSSSKQNTYEAEMVLKVVRYLAQQGYKSDNLVVLTPYLGQLLKIRDALAKDNDPVLSDLDSHEISFAGISLDPRTSKGNKNARSRIRIATIDNYQGEESDIVIASLTRSNPSNSIGFMNSPERLNVLLSRARNGLILIGNSHTFLHSKQGGALWRKLFELLRNGQHVYSGFPIKCERHPQRTLVLKNAAEFDDYAPDGGCTEPCGIRLKCGLHQCPKKCHPARTAPNQGDVHLTMPCTYRLQDKCDAGLHTLSWECHKQRPSTCSACQNEAKRLEEQARRDLEAQQKRAVAQYEHELQMADLEAKLAAEKEELRHALQFGTADQMDVEDSSSGTSTPLRIPESEQGYSIQGTGDEEQSAAFQDVGVHGEAKAELLVPPYFPCHMIKIQLHRVCRNPKSRKQIAESKNERQSWQD
ncbi:P-loop containing nucleoside triphosphate hydrolase protein [Phlebopus sp. FC_14]|nr:P-loop containing nucleoside triphosphate hydrolase protein [Phlebopus sp. FC_14]